MRDAPYIEDAMRYGMPHPRRAICPNCGKECDTIFAIGSEALGCEHCVDVVDADEWLREEEEH